MDKVKLSVSIMGASRERYKAQEDTHGNVGLNARLSLSNRLSKQVPYPVCRPSDRLQSTKLEAA